MATPTTLRQEVQVGIGKAALALGTLVYARQGRREHCAFAYDQAWLNHPERFGVSADLPLVAGYQAHKAASAHDSVFHGAIADTAPDAWGRRVNGPRPRQAPPHRPATARVDGAGLCAGGGRFQPLGRIAAGWRGRRMAAHRGAGPAQHAALDRVGADLPCQPGGGAWAGNRRRPALPAGQGHVAGRHATQVHAD